MSQNIFRNFENFWDKNDIKKKAESYQNYYKNNKGEDFSWINEKDKDSLKKRTVKKSMKWGIPNHILGDIDKSKFIIGLLNPGTHMKKEESEACNTVGEYIEHEIEIEKKENQNFSFTSKEVYEEHLNKDLNMYDFYYSHILSRENVLSQELKKLYQVYLNNNSLPDDNKILSQIAYYFSKYYKGGFNSESSQIKSAKCHYERIFEKINVAKRKADKKKIDQKFEKALFEMPITNIELIPYRTKKSPNAKLIGLESSKISANAIIEKIMQDKDTVVILRSYDREKEEDKEDKYNWKKLFENICEEKNINFKEHIEPSIYTLKNDQGGSISANSIKPANPNNSMKSEKQVVRELNESINLSDFEKELDYIIEENNKM